ncbi:MAG: integrase, partial [Gammaproteobacteria bacterium]|nr:integrase [Gammaproteobacteria bacterium]
DLRAAYACERYEQITGHPAPVVAGERQANKHDDQTARQIIAQELGHGRIDVAAAYLGK